MPRAGDSFTKRSFRSPAGVAFRATVARKAHAAAGTKPFTVSVLPDESTLQLLFAELNYRHFNGQVPAYRIAYNGRFSSVAGRITYRPPIIEISKPHHLRHPEALRDTLLHEMIHAWCFALRGETGHSPAFKKKMRELGLRSIYHDMGVARDFDPEAKRYLLRCAHCATELIRKRKPAEPTACARCGRGRFNLKYVLQIFEITGLREVAACPSPAVTQTSRW